MRKSIFVLFLCGCIMSVNCVASGSIDPPSQQSRKLLVAEMADLIKEYAYFHAGSAVFRYDARIDTIGAIKLFVNEQVKALGNRAEYWYCIDFDEPVKSNDFTVVMLRNDSFLIQSAKTITEKIGKKKEKNRKLFVRFFTNENKRTTDFKQLHDRLVDIVSQLTTL